MLPYTTRLIRLKSGVPYTQNMSYVGLLKIMLRRPYFIGLGWDPGPWVYA